MRLRFLGRLFSTFTTSGSLSEDDLLGLEDESSSESLELEFVLSLLGLLDFCGLGVLSCLLDFFGFSSWMVSSFLPSILSAILLLSLLSLVGRGSIFFSGVSLSTGGGVADDPK